MPSSRVWRREARVLTTLSELCGDERTAPLIDVIAIDFLLQHPTILKAYIGLDTEPWPAQSHPTATESDSSEEAFLRWKRAAGLSLMAPIIGRHIARGLVTRPRPDELVVTAAGAEAAESLASAAEASEQERLSLVSGTFIRDRSRAHDQLARALAQGAV